MKALLIILFIVGVWIFAWALCVAAKGGLPDAEDVVEAWDWMPVENESALRVPEIPLPIKKQESMKIWLMESTANYFIYCWSLDICLPEPEELTIDSVTIKRVFEDIEP